MKENKNKQLAYEEPLLEVVHLTEADIITASAGGDEETPEEYEGEMIVNFDHLN